MKQGYSSKMWLGSLFGGSKAPDKQETRADLLGHDGPGLGKDAQHILTRWAPPSAISRVITPLIVGRKPQKAIDRAFNSSYN